jgi:hypothetical protein
VKALLDAALPVQLSDRSAALACPACGFLTVSDSYYGSYAICGVCDWEDDGVQLANPACGGGANHESLIDAQRAALGRFPLAVAEAAGFRRSPIWRPLNEMEVAVAVAVASAERDEKYWRNQAVSLPHECYWTRGAQRRPTLV